MSYSICRISKIKSAGVTGIQIHDRREKKGISHTNEDIDWTKKDQNIDLINQQEKFQTVVKNRIGELDLAHGVRKNATVMCQCLITSDNTFFQSMSKAEQIDFFKKSLDFMENRYGKQNMVSATVHFDEMTPHMHVNFVPVTSDGRLSARDLFSPGNLRKLQDDFNRHCKENGYDLERGKLHSKKEHLSVEEYKIETKFEQLKDKIKELEKLESIDNTVNLEAEKKKMVYMPKEVDQIKDQNKSLKVELHDKDLQITTLKREIEELNKSLSETKKDLNTALKPSRNLNDLKSEIKAFESYLNKHPDIKNKMQPYEISKKQSYEFGNKLVEIKRSYGEILNEKNQSIQKTLNIEKKVVRWDEITSDLTQIKNSINASMQHIKALEVDLSSKKGFFNKGKDIQSEIKVHQDSIQGLKAQLRDKYKIEFEDIDRGFKNIETKKDVLIQEKNVQKSHTDQCEMKLDTIVKSYKYTKNLSNLQDGPFRDISDRIDSSFQLDINSSRNLRITKDDRKWLLEDIEKFNPEFKDACKNMYDQSDQAALNKTIQKKAQLHLDMEL